MKMDKRTLYKSIMENVSREIMDTLNEANGFEGMDPEAAERLRRVKNRYASYKSKGGSQKAKEKIIADFQNVVDDIVNPKAKARVQAIIDQLSGGASTLVSNTPVTPSRPSVSSVTPTPADEEDDDEPEIPVNRNHISEPEIPAYDDVDTEDEPNDEPEIPAYDDIDTEDEPEEDTNIADNISDREVANILNDTCQIAKDVLLDDDLETLDVDNWIVEPYEENGRNLYRIIVKPGIKASLGQNAIDAMANEYDKILKPVLLKVKRKYNITSDALDTCLYDETDSTIAYGIDYDSNY